jgi:Cu2+-exporting ATPase
MDARFCCAGCGHVYEFLRSQGLERFYELRGAQNMAPVSPQALRERDYEWLADLVRDAEASTANSSRAQLRLEVQGLSCIGCVWLMERVFRSMPGAWRIEVNASRGELQLEWKPGACDIVDFARRLQQLGYMVGKADSSRAASANANLNRRVGLCGAFAMNAMAFCLPSYMGMSKDFMFASWFDLVAACSATLSLLVGGSYFAARSWQTLKHGVLHIDTPITLGIATAWIGSMVGWLAQIPRLKYFDFVSIFVFLMLAGRWLQQAAVERNRSRLLRLGTVPESVDHLEQQGVSSRIALDEVKPGMSLRIKPGEVCPVDSVLRSATGSLSLEWINGESRAAPRTKGQTVPSGALNISARPLVVEARECWKDALLHRLVESRRTDRSAEAYFAGLLRGYLTAVILLGFGGAALWWLRGHDAGTALQVMISVFVVSCPCALGVAAPFADDLAACWMERLGVFVRTHGLWQKLVRVHRIVFDKTGTLTLENPVLRNPESLRELDASAKTVLAALAGSNLHPVSRSLFDALGPSENVAFQGSVEETVGQGLLCKDAEGATWSLGRPNWRGGNAEGPESKAGDAEFCREGRVLATFHFENALRPETRSAFARLREQRFTLAMLSGDREAKVRHAAQVLNLKDGEWHAEMTPDAKAGWVRANDKRHTLFVGDGANDSLALDAALCGGSPVTGGNFLEHKADFYFLGSSLCFLPDLLDVARRRQRAVRRVFGFAVAYNVGAIALSLTGHMSPLLAAILMPLSSLATLALARLSFGSRLRASGNTREAQNPESCAQPVHGEQEVAAL